MSLGSPASASASLATGSVSVTISGLVDTSCSQTATPPCYAYDATIKNSNAVAITAMTIDLVSGDPITSFSLGAGTFSATGVGDALGAFNIDILPNTTVTGTLLLPAPLVSTDVVELYLSPDGFVTSISVDATLSLTPAATGGGGDVADLENAIKSINAAIEKESRASKDVEHAEQAGAKSAAGRASLDAAKGLLFDAEADLRSEMGSVPSSAGQTGSVAGDETAARGDVSAAVSADQSAAESIKEGRGLGGVVADLARAEHDKKHARASLDEALRFSKG